MGGSPLEPARPAEDAVTGTLAEPRYAASLERLREGLALLVEAMDELALEILHDAAEAGARARPELERRVTRARNGVERALHVLGGDENGST